MFISISLAIVGNNKKQETVANEWFMGRMKHGMTLAAFHSPRNWLVVRNKLKLLQKDNISYFSDR